MPLDPADRYRRYLAAIGPAVEGSGGDQKTYEAIRAAWGFGLDERDARAPLAEWNSTCSPPWSERELDSKVASVYRRTTLPRGYMLTDDQEWAPPARREPKYPDGAEQWFCSLPQGDADEAVMAWVEARGIDPDGFRRAGGGMFVRAARPGPAWARFADGRPWSAAGFSAVFPCFDTSGTIRSVRARRTAVVEDPLAGFVEAKADGPKAVPPFGHDTAGLVLANLAGAARLNGDYRIRRFWIVEGEPDTLAMSVALAGKGRMGEAVFGLFSGAWSWEMAKVFGQHDVVTVATHDDLQGRKYAEEVQASLYGKVNLKRYVPKDSR